MCSDSAYALISGACAAGGRACSASGTGRRLRRNAGLDESRRAAGPRAGWSRCCRARPRRTAPPSVRKKVTPDVAVPEIAVLGGVLHDQREDLHDQADAGTQDEEVERLHHDRGVLVQQRHQIDPDRGDRGAGDREHPVLAGPADDGAAGDGGQQQPDHQRQHPQPGRGRRCAADELQQGGQEGDRTDHREADDEAQDRRQGEHPAAEQPHRQDRLRPPGVRRKRRWPARSARPRTAR